MPVHKIKVVQTKDVGTQIFVDGKYLTTYMGHYDTLKYQLESSGNTYLENIKKLGRFEREGCKGVHIFMTLDGFKYCPLCGENLNPLDLTPDAIKKLLTTNV